jgi:hypothetical protein
MLVSCVTVLTGWSGPEMLLEIETDNFVVTVQQH